MSQRSTAIRVGVVALLLLLPEYAGRPGSRAGKMDAGPPGLWAGEMPSQSRPGPVARVIDPAAVAVLQAMDDAFAGAQGLVASYRMEAFRPTGQPQQTELLELRLGRPNLYELRWVNGTAPPRRIIASNGKNRYSVMTTASRATAATAVRCLVSDVAPLNDAREIDTFNPVYWSFYNLGEWQIRSALLGHWSTKWRLQDPGTRTVKYVGREKLGDLPVDVVEWTYTIGYNYPDDDPVYTSRLSIGLDHFVRRIETTSTSKKDYEGRRIVETISDIRTTALQPASAFAYTPPAGAACQPYDQEAVYTTGQYSDLPIGSKAPDFTLQTARGETLRFSELLRQHKVVLMNYWGYG